LLLGSVTKLEIKAEEQSSYKGVIEYVLSPEGRAQIGFYLAVLGFLGVDAKTILKSPIVILKFFIDIIKKSHGKIDDINRQISELNIERNIKNKLVQIFLSVDFRRLYKMISRRYL
jgi:hypothetical protein